MRTLINGVEGLKLGLYKGGAETLRIRLTNDDGSNLVLTGGTVSCQFFDTKDRRNVATVLTKAGTLVTAANGVVTLTLLATDMVFGPSANNVPYYLFVKFTSAATDEFVGLIPAEVIIK